VQKSLIHNLHWVAARPRKGGKNWAQLSNECRESEKAGDRTEWKFESGDFGDFRESGGSDKYGDSGESVREYDI